MIYELLTNPLLFIIWFFALLVAVTIHEFAHSAMADHLGDPTPRIMGRLSLNPLAHLDPIGTLMLLFFRFGWGKPVPIDPFNLQDPRRDQALISLAWPTSNLLLATLLSLPLHLGGVMAYASLQPATSEVFISVPSVWQAFYSLFPPIIFLNVVLAIFNLLPVYPLDGFKIVLGFLPSGKAYQWEELKTFGPLFLFLLIFPFFGQSAVGLILGPIINFLLQILVPGSYTLI